MFFIPRAPEAPPVMRPVVRASRAHCPRCDSRLMRDYDLLLCLTCGYEYEPGADDAEWRELFRPKRAAAIAVPLLFIGRLTNPFVAAVTAIVAVGLVVRMWTQRRA